MIRAKWSLDLITIGSAIYCRPNAFFLSLVRTKVTHMLLTCSDDIFWWKFLFRSYFQDVESVFPKYSIHTDVVTDTKDSSAWSRADAQHT